MISGAMSIWKDIPSTKKVGEVKENNLNGSPWGRKNNSLLIVVPLLERARDAGAQIEKVFLIGCGMKI